MKRYCLHVEGDFACFTRPEMKVERVSYDVITPSAARAIFEAVLWKPAIAWTIHKIEVLKPIRWFSVRRNEVGSKIPVRNIQAAMSGGNTALALNIEDDRQQRASLILRDVAYRLHASFKMTPQAGEADNLAKFDEMFQRRAMQGQSFHQPYLGCREFPCSFRLAENTENETPPIDETRDLGWMLYDMDYACDPSAPLFFRAELKNGIVELDGKEIRG